MYGCVYCREIEVVVFCYCMWLSWKQYVLPCIETVARSVCCILDY